MHPCPVPQRYSGWSTSCPAFDLMIANASTDCLPSASSQVPVSVCMYVPGDECQALPLCSMPRTPSGLGSFCGSVAIQLESGLLVCTFAGSPGSERFPWKHCHLARGVKDSPPLLFTMGTRGWSTALLTKLTTHSLPRLPTFTQFSSVSGWMDQSQATGLRPSCTLFLSEGIWQQRLPSWPAGSQVSSPVTSLLWWMSYKMIYAPSFCGSGESEGEGEGLGHSESGSGLLWSWPGPWPGPCVAPIACLSQNPPLQISESSLQKVD